MGKRNAWQVRKTEGRRRCTCVSNQNLHHPPSWPFLSLDRRQQRACGNHQETHQEPSVPTILQEHPHSWESATRCSLYIRYPDMLQHPLTTFSRRFSCTSISSSASPFHLSTQWRQPPCDIVPSREPSETRNVSRVVHLKQRSSHARDRDLTQHHASRVKVSWGKGETRHHAVNRLSCWLRAIQMVE
ncbi:hypothetical protein EX30DRAFT_43151 [Ascodesmis nigricans]|uniref:Uncharacterized protein n=1 Tax=Ascodesmis nigricans TaxID=341454 RepID=A0A4S2MWA7_9PEZI|nr:hypothetical protein EX30DRAFT_43151 [Ascodesmis nigricans]